jgi:hypothetical protein
MTTFTPSITATDAAAELREMLAETGTVYVISRRVSTSGMNRKVSLLVLDTSDGIPELVDITTRAAAVMGDRVHEVNGHHALSVNGVGQDMHFATVYRLSGRLYADESTRLPDSARDPRGAYALTHRTL